MVESIKYIFFFISFLSMNTHEVLHSQTIKLDDLSKKINEINLKDTIHIESGVYTDIITKINVKNPKERVVIKPKVEGTVIIKGNSSFIIKNSSNITFEGFLFKDTENSTFIISNSSKIIIHDNYFEECGSYPTHAIIRMVNKVFDNEVSYNTFNKSKAMCIAMFTKNQSPVDSLNKNNIIYRNIFKNIPSVTSTYPKAKTTNGMEAIMLGTGYGKTLDYQLNNKIIENLFINIIGDRQEIISNKSSGNKILRNSFINNLSGLSLRSGNNVLVKDNYFNGTKRGVRVFGKNHIIENNFIEKSDFGFRLPKTNSSRLSLDYKEKGYQQQQNIYFINNTVLNPIKDAILYDEGSFNYSAQNIIIDCNKFYLKSKKSLINKKRKSKTIKNNNKIFIELPDSDSLYSHWLKSIDDYKSFKDEKNKGCSWRRI